jgi:hypothetical protein
VCPDEAAAQEKDTSPTCMDRLKQEIAKLCVNRTDILLCMKDRLFWLPGSLLNVLESENLMYAM